MDKLKKSQILKLFLIVMLLSVTPMLTASWRPPFLYYVVNLVILSLGAEALLSFPFKASEGKKAAAPPAAAAATSVAQKSSLINTNAATAADFAIKDQSQTMIKARGEEPTKKKPQLVVETSSSAKIFSTLSKCITQLPLQVFFISCGDHIQIGAVEAELIEDTAAAVEDQDYEAAAYDGELSRLELFHKAETFIGNFYKQLKMQREDSWKKIHGLSHKSL